jgi:hypothetical protein
MERRGVGQEVVHVTIEVASEAKSGIIGYAAIEAVKRVVGASRNAIPAWKQTPRPTRTTSSAPSIGV